MRMIQIRQYLEKRGYKPDDQHAKTSGAKREVRARNEPEEVDELEQEDRRERLPDHPITHTQQDRVERSVLAKHDNETERARTNAAQTAPSLVPRPCTLA